MKTIMGLLALCAALIYLIFGTLAPCGIVREMVRKQDGLAAILPDGLIDAALVNQFGALSPGRCLNILVQNYTAPISKSAEPVKPVQRTAAPENPDPIKRAFEISKAAINECRSKRLSGELKTYVESVQCANSRMIAAFQSANYRYMDLISLFATKRIAIAEKLDRREISETQAQAENQNAFAQIQELERARNLH